MNDYAVAAPPSRGGMKFRHILVLVFIAFIGGVIATGWLAQRAGYWDGDLSPQPANVARNITAPTKPPFSAVLPLDDTVTNIENRLSRINADAAAASGNAARAEGLLIAFAARRAIDSGAPLGYLADQLRLRFGSAQPQAVATILSASRTPVTLETLQAELDTLDNVLVTGDRDAGVWSNITQEFSELFVLRKEGAPSPAPRQRMARIHTLTESGNISGAIAEVSTMPGAGAASDWLVKARRYNDARQALDLLERSAIVAPAPATIPIVPAEPGRTLEQVAPVAAK